MLKNLENMSNNMGYIWRDIHCYGKKPVNPRDRGKYTLFEKKNGKHYVHVCTDTTHELYEKDRDGKRYLIEKRNRNKL